MTLQSERGKDLSEHLRETRPTPEARAVEVLVDISQHTLDDFGDGGDD